MIALIFFTLQMTHLRANCNLFCKSCGIELGFIRPNVNVAHFLYCEECDKAQKILPDHVFLQNWDEDIFLEPFADFTLEGSDGGIVRAHKAVLAGKSKVFKAMLRAGMSESVSGKVKIGDMTAGELRPLIDFLYSGSVNQRSLECHGVALYRASVKYDLPLLTAMCERFLEINVSRDIRGVFELAVDYEVEKLQEVMLPLIFSRGFVESNRPALAMKILRAASKFECFLAYRKKNKKLVSLIMEIVFYRVADFCDNLQKEVEELQKGADDPNEVVLTMAMSTSTSSFDRFCFSPTPMRLKTAFGGGHQTSTSDPPKVMSSAPILSTILNKSLKGGNQTSTSDLPKVVVSTPLPTILNKPLKTMATSTSTSSFDRINFLSTPLQLRTPFGGVHQTSTSDPPKVVVSAPPLSTVLSKALKGGHQTSTSNSPKVVVSVLPLSTTLNKPLKHATSPSLPITPVARHDSLDIGGGVKSDLDISSLHRLKRSRDIKDF